MGFIMALNLDLVSIEINGALFDVKCLNTSSTVRGIIGANGELLPTHYTGKINLYKSLFTFAREFKQAQKVGILIEHLPAIS